jgi:hypothetical protein
LIGAIDPETEVVTQTATNVPTLFTFQSTTGATGSVTSLTKVIQVKHYLMLVY